MNLAGIIREILLTNRLQECPEVRISRETSSHKKIGSQTKRTYFYFYSGGFSKAFLNRRQSLHRILWEHGHTWRQTSPWHLQ